MAETDLQAAVRARLGRVLREKYRLDRVIGSGGMAAVYAATHRNTKMFAVKMLHPELSVRSDVRTRFLREGYVANSVKHPGAVAVMDDDVAEDGSAFLVMELLEGMTVNDLPLRAGAREADEALLPLVLSIGDALLDVLASAHARGIVHRDIKPANLFLTHEGVLKVLDFGIARLLENVSAEGSATLTGALMGTPAFMAPEQALAKASEIDAQTDLWAVGATLFNLLGGQIVHTGDNAAQILVNAATTHARPLSAVAKHVPAGIAAVIDRALAFERKDRWPSAAAMREALKAACVEGTGSTIAPLPKSAPSATETVVASGGGNFSDTAFAPTIDPSGAPTPARSGASAVRASGATTAEPVASTRPEGPARAAAPSKKSTSLFIVAPVVAAVAAAVVVAVGYPKPRGPEVAACAAVEDGVDGPRCIVPLSSTATVARGERTPKLVTERGRVRAVTWQGVRETDDDAEVSETVTRDANGDVSEVRAFDAGGDLVRWEKWSKLPDGQRRVDLVDVDGTTPRVLPKTHISSFVRSYDASGRLVRETTLGPSGRARPNENGEYGSTFEYGASARWTKRHILAADGKPGVGKHGEATIVRSDDDTPTGRELSTLGADGQSVSVAGVAHVKRTFTSEGALASVVLADADGAEVTAATPDDALRARRVRWDATRRVLEATDTDAQGQPRARRGEAAVSLRTTYDAEGRVTLREFLDANGNRVRTRTLGSGAAAVRYTWNSGGKELSRELLGVEDRLIIGEAGFARRTSAYDARGFVTERRAFDEAGQPTPWRDGGAIDRMIVDDRGLATQVTHLDASERPMPDRQGIAETRRKYDRRRNLIEEASFDVDGKPTSNEDGVSIVRRTYDENDDLIRLSYFDAAGAPLMLRGEWAEERTTYDERGLAVAVELFDAHGDRAVRGDGASTVRTVRDRNGDPVSESTFGRHDEIIVTSGGFARKNLKYDAHRRLVATTLLGVGGEPVRGADGWAVEETTYDARDLVVRVDHEDARGKPVLVREGGASIERTWDSRGNMLSETTLGIDGKPTTTASGYATRKNEYDDHDRLVGEARFAASSKQPVSQRRIRYDEIGNVVEETLNPPGAYASVKYLLDARQRLVETSFFDATGAPSGSDGIATIRYERDVYGRTTQTTTFGRNGSPIASKDGKVVVRSTYDAAGRVVLERFVDVSGAPKAAATGCSAMRMKYDAHGRTTETACLDAKTEPVLSVDGYAMQRSVYDARGNEVDLSTWGADGQPIANKEGIARRHDVYDDRNLVVSTTYFDAADRPTRDSRGVHETRFGYGPTGQALPPKYFDEHGTALALALDGAPASTAPNLPALPGTTDAGAGSPTDAAR